MHRLNARHRAIAEAATEDFGQAADKDRLWNRLIIANVFTGRPLI